MEDQEEVGYYNYNREREEEYKEIREHERRIREGNMGVFGLSSAFIVGFLIFIFVIRFIENKDW